jgi:hypothetical protein
VEETPEETPTTEYSGSVAQPEFECVARQVWTELVHEERPEISVPSLAEQLPNIVVTQRVKCGDLKLQKVVLHRAEVDGVNTLGLLEGK